MRPSPEKPQYEAVSASESDGDVVGDRRAYRVPARTRRRQRLLDLGLCVTVLVGIVAVFLLGCAFGYYGRDSDAVGTAQSTTTAQSSSSSSSGDGKSCTEPYYRREWRTLSADDKKAYLDAFTCMTKTPSRLRDEGSVYDDFAWVHNSIAHETHAEPPFLTWHRRFIATFEAHLRSVCAYKGALPYWDWSLDWEALPSAAVFSETLGFGGDGAKGSPLTIGGGRCVTTGPFANLRPLFSASYHQPHCLSRGFADEWFGDYLRPQQIETVFQAQNYEEFFVALERVHDVIPLAIGGDFVNFTAPNEPLFYLHHAQLDRLWAKWQENDRSTRLTSYGGIGLNGNTVKLTDNLTLAPLDFRNVTVAEIMDTRGGELCYRYM